MFCSFLLRWRIYVCTGRSWKKSFEIEFPTITALIFFSNAYSFAINFSSPFFWMHFSLTLFCTMLYLCKHNVQCNIQCNILCSLLVLIVVLCFLNIFTPLSAKCKQYVAIILSFVCTRKETCKGQAGFVLLTLWQYELNWKRTRAEVNKTFKLPIAHS